VFLNQAPYLFFKLANLFSRRNALRMGVIKNTREVAPFRSAFADVFALRQAQGRKSKLNFLIYKFFAVVKINNFQLHMHIIPNQS